MFPKKEKVKKYQNAVMYKRAQKLKEAKKLKRKMEKIAFALGLAFAIPLTIWSPNLALISSGLVGGTIAYVIFKKGDQDGK